MSGHLSAPPGGRRDPVLGPESSVLALVPHYRCEEWLGDCLESLLSQTRPLQGIVVVDDHSEVPPLEIVRCFPGVTLLRSEENVGPYRLIQRVIEHASYDAYLFNDADDWSAPQRLEVLLAEAARSDAELIGSQEVRILCDEGEAQHIAYPLDVNVALREQPCSFPLLHPTSLVARALVMRLGGFATGLRFSGDAEFLRRAGYAGKIVNVPHYLYFRRKREGALTTAAETGLRSPARLEVQRILFERARENAEREAEGREPELEPLSVAPPVRLVHLWGPEVLRGGQPLAIERLHSYDAPNSPRKRGPSVVAEATETPSDENDAGPSLSRGSRRGDPPRPVFVIGAPRSGGTLLMWCLGHHPNLRATPQASWVGELAQDLERSLARARADADGTGYALSETAEGALHAGFGDLLHRSIATPAHFRWVDATPENVFRIHALNRLFPYARFIHVVRDAASVVRSLAHVPGSDGSYYTEGSATERWLRAARAGLSAERALGSRNVLRVRHAELVESPEAVIRRCLAHLEEPFSADSLRPLHALEVHAESVSAPPLELAPEVHQLSRELVRAPIPDFPGCAEAFAELARVGTRKGSEAAADPGHESPVQRFRDVVRAAVPAEATVLVVSRGDESLLRLEGRRAWHFPREENGAYAGYYPAESTEAIRHLEQLRRQGADYIAFPCTSFWWLDHYAELRANLETHYRLAAFQEDVCLVYALRPAPASPTNGLSAPRPARIPMPAGIP